MNPTRLVAISILVALGACSSPHELAVAKGPVFALNPGRWQPSAQDLTLIKTTSGDFPAAAPVAPALPIVLTPEVPLS